MTVTLHRADYRGQMHCMKCLARDAAPAAASASNEPQRVVVEQRKQSDGVMMTTIKIAAFIIALLFLVSFATCFCGTAAVVHEVHSGSGN